MKRMTKGKIYSLSLFKRKNICEKKKKCCDKLKGVNYKHQQVMYMVIYILHGHSMPKSYK